MKIMNLQFFAAAGRVATGFSKPYVAKYISSGSSVIYTGCRRLARGVNVNIQPESSDDNNFYADNQAAESASGVFTGGTLELEVDGLFTSSYNYIMGVQDVVSGWTADGNKAEVPYMGVGFIVRWMSAGVTTYQPVVIAKTKFSIPEEERATQEDEIDWQTTSLSANMMRDDTVEEAWRYRGEDYATEAEAEAALVERLGGTEPTEVASLTALSIAGIAIEPAFSADVLSYTGATTDESSVVTATGDTDVTVSATLNGTAVDLASAVTWSRGLNLLAITAAKEGSESTIYSVVITKADPSETAKLTGISVDSLALDPTFDADITAYAVDTTDASNVVDATGDTGVSVSATLNGSDFTLGTAASWNEGDNTVVITASKSGATSTSYTVTVTKS